MKKSTRGTVFRPTSKVHPTAKRAAIAAAAIAACIQVSHAQMLEEVVVTSGKLEQQLFDAPASVSRVGGVSVFKWFETDGLISQRRDWLIGFKV